MSKEKVEEFNKNYNIKDCIEFLLRNDLTLKQQENIIDYISKNGNYYDFIDVINKTNINIYLQSQLINSIKLLDEPIIVELLIKLNKVPHNELIKLINKLCESDKIYYKRNALKSKLLSIDLYNQIIDSIFNSKLRLNNPKFYINELINLYIYNKNINLDFFKLLIIKYSLVELFTEYQSLIYSYLKLIKIHDEKINCTSHDQKIRLFENFLRTLETKECSKQYKKLI